MNKTPCDGCADLNPDGLCRKSFRKCPEWYGWFCTEWAEIQAAAEEMHNGEMDEQLHT